MCNIQIVVKAKVFQKGAIDTHTLKRSDKAQKDLIEHVGRQRKRAKQRVKERRKNKTRRIDRVKDVRGGA